MNLLQSDFYLMEMEPDEWNADDLCTSVGYVISYLVSCGQKRDMRQLVREEHFSKQHCCTTYLVIAI